MSSPSPVLALETRLPRRLQDLKNLAKPRKCGKCGNLESRSRQGARVSKKKSLHAPRGSFLPRQVAQPTNPRLHQKYKNRRLICSQIPNNVAVLYRCRYRILFLLALDFHPPAKHTTQHKPNSSPSSFLPLLQPDPTQPTSTPHNTNFPLTIAIPISFIPDGALFWLLDSVYHQRFHGHILSAVRNPASQPSNFSHFTAVLLRLHRLNSSFTSQFWASCRTRNPYLSPSRWSA